MTRKIAFCVALVFVAASVCAAENAQQTTESTTKHFDIGACYSTLWMDDRASPVKTRLGIGQSPIPLALRASKDKASTKEKQSLSFVADAMQTCQQMHMPSRVNYPKQVAQIMLDLERTTISNLANLYARDISWGEAIGVVERISEEFNRKMAEYNAEARAANLAYERRQAENKAQADALASAQRQADAERRYQQAKMEQLEQQFKERQQQQQFMNGLMLLNTARQAPAPLPAPNFGTQCQSRALGGTFYTNCN